MLATYSDSSPALCQHACASMFAAYTYICTPTSIVGPTDSIEYNEIITRMTAADVGVQYGIDTRTIPTDSVHSLTYNDFGNCRW